MLPFKLRPPPSSTTIAKTNNPGHIRLLVGHGHSTLALARFDPMTSWTLGSRHEEGLGKASALKPPKTTSHSQSK